MLGRSALGRLPSYGVFAAKCGEDRLWHEGLTSKVGRGPALSAGLYSSSACRLHSSLISTNPITMSSSQTATQILSSKTSSSFICIASNSAQHAYYSQKRPLKSLTSLERIPKGSWDSHMHVVDPTHYPLSSTAAYTPHAHLLPEAMAFEFSVKLSNIVLVQPSIYGNDNSCMLDALRSLGPKRGRAVVTFDPTTIDQATLQNWHDIGVRGVRINLKSVGRPVVASELEIELKQYADLIKPFGWVIQLFIGLESVPVLEPLVDSLGVKVCIDHLGAPTLPEFFGKQSDDPYTLPGFSSLINLLKRDKTYVKLSAPYRISKDEEQKDFEILAKEVLRVAGRRKVVFATDWPHTRFDGVDIRPFAQKCLEWCGDDDLMVDRIFRKNAEDLWDVR